MAEPQTDQILKSIDSQLEDLYGLKPLPEEAYKAPDVDPAVLVNEALKILRFPDPENPDDRLDPSRDEIDRTILKKTGRPYFTKRRKADSSEKQVDPYKYSPEQKKVREHYRNFLSVEDITEEQEALRNQGGAPSNPRQAEILRLGLQDVKYGQPGFKGGRLSPVVDAGSGAYKEWLPKYTPFERREAREFARFYYKNKEREEAQRHHKEYYQRLSDLYGPVIGDAFLGNVGASLEGSSKRAASAFGRVVRWSEKGDLDASRLTRDAQLMDEAATEVLGTGEWGQAFRGATSSVIEASAAGTAGPPGIIGWFTLSRANEAVYEADQAGLTGKDKTWYVVTSGGIEGGVTAVFSLIGLGGFESQISKGLVRNSLKGALKELGIQGVAELTEEEIIALGDAANRTLSGVDETAAHPDRLGPLLQDTFRTTLLAQGYSSGRSWVGRHYANKELEKAQELAKKDKLSRGDVEDMGVTEKTSEGQRNPIHENMVEEVNRIKAGEAEVDPDLGPTQGEVTGTEEPVAHPGPPVQAETEQQALQQQIAERQAADAEAQVAAQEQAAAEEAATPKPTPLEEAPTETAPAPVEPIIVRGHESREESESVSGPRKTFPQLTQEGNAYRGMTQDEFNATVGTGQGVESTGAWSAPDEGTSFATDFGTAEDYANFGRTDPRETGKPTYVVEVSDAESLEPGLGGTDYLRSPAGERISQDRVTRVWEMKKDGDKIVAREIAVPPQAVAPVEAAPLEAEPEQPIQHTNEGTTVHVPVARVDELKAQGQSEAAAESQAAAEQDVPVDTSGMPKWQKALYEAGRGNTIVTNDQLGGILGDINQAITNLAKGHTPGSVFPITDELVRSVTKLLVYMAEAAAKSSVQLTKKNIRASAIEFLRQYPPFNFRMTRGEQRRTGRKDRWQITDAEIGEMLERKVTLEYVVTFEDGTKRIIMADSAEEAGFKAQAWQDNDVPRWIDNAAQIDPTLPEQARSHSTVKSVKPAKARSIMERVKDIYDKAKKMPSRRVVVNQQINWTEGETVEKSARQLLLISLRRQERAAREGYTAAVVNEGTTWQGLIDSAQQLPDGVEKRNVLKILSRLARERSTTPRGKVAFEKAVKALNILHEKYEHASALAELRKLKAKIAKADIDPDYKIKLAEILDGLRLTNHRQTTLDRMEKLLKAAANDDIGQIPQFLVDKANEIISQYDDSVKPAKDMEAAALRAITHKIESLLRQMVRKRVLTIQGQEVDRAELEETGGSDITERANKSRGVESFSGKIKKPMHWFKRLLWFDQASGDTLAHMLGGATSTFYHVVSTRLRRSRDEFASIQQSALLHVRKALKNAGISPETFGSMSRIGGDNVALVNIALPTARLVKNGKPVGRKDTLTLTVDDKIGLYLNLQDRETRAEILSDRGAGIEIFGQEAGAGESITLTIKDVVAIEESMTDQELSIAADLSKFINDNDSDTGLLRRINGEWVNQFGYKLQTHENHWPRSRARKKSDTSPTNVTEQFVNESLANLSMFQSRSSSPRAIVIHGAFGTFLAHVNGAASFVTMHGATNDALSMLNSTPVQDALIDTQEHHETWTQQLTETIGDFRGLQRKTADASMEKGLRKLINNSHIAALGLKAHIALFQTASFITAATQLGMGAMVSGVKGLNRETLAEIMQYSGTLAQRLTSGGMNILSADYTGNVSLEFYGGVPNQRLTRIKRKTEQAAMWMIKKMDQAVIQSIWQAAKNEGIGRGLEGEDLMAFTRDRAVDVVDFTQPTWDQLTTSTMGLAGRRAPALKMLATMFASQRNKNFNIIMKAYSDFMAADNKVEESKRLFGTLATVGVAQSAVVYGISHLSQYALAAMWGDDEELEELEGLGYDDHAIEILRKSMGNWLIFGDAINAVVGMFREKEMSAGFRRTRGTILSGVVIDGAEAIYGLKEGINQWWDDERYTQWPTKGETRHWDTLSEALEKFISFSGVGTGWPSGGVVQVLGRAMPHRGKKRWKHDPMQQLHELHREWGRATVGQIEKKLKLKPKGVALQAELAEAKRVRRDNQFAHDLWVWAEGHTLWQLEKARRGKKVDKVAQIGAMTHLNGMADAYQEYAKTGNARDLLDIVDEGFKGKIVNSVVQTVSRDQRGVTEKEQAKELAKNEADRKLYLPIVKQMTREEAITALRWGHIQGAKPSTLRRYAAIEQGKNGGLPFRGAMRELMETTDTSSLSPKEVESLKQEMVDYIMSVRHTSGPLTGLPRFAPPGRSYGDKEKKIDDLFGYSRQP